MHSVDPDRLTGHGYAVTVTLRDCPPSAKEFARLRTRFLEALRGFGRERFHWVMELAQADRGGVPHLHWAVYFDHELTGHELWQIKDAWCRIAGRFGARHVGQHVDRIRPGVGWAKYCAKHASRTAGHSQRRGVPAGWEDSSGRMWGRGGDWPTRLDRWLLNGRAVDQVKRLLGSYLVADAVTSARKLCAHRAGRPVMWTGLLPVQHRRGVAAARRLLRSNPELRQVYGVRAWIPEATMAAIMRHVAGLPGCVVAEILDDAGGGAWWRVLMRGRHRARDRLGVVEPANHVRPKLTVRPVPEAGPALGPMTARQSMIVDLRWERGHRCESSDCCWGWGQLAWGSTSSLPASRR